jgi:tRNA pseudouridine38-40 synthase
MALYRVTIAYDGTEYEGWQVQAKGRTIQGTIEAALSRMAKRPVTVVGASRTDAGVHALGQVAHFEIANSIPPEGLRRGLNSLLPEDIRILETAFAPQAFHARKLARSKTYRYFLDTRPVPSPLRIRFAYHYPHRLDRAAMAEAARLFLGTKDFAAFRAASCEARTTVRDLTVSRLLEEGEELVYEVVANGFLHHMVRNLLGTLLQVGRGRLAPSAIEDLLAQKDRRLTGPTAPARGLHLMRVEYG